MKSALAERHAPVIALMNLLLPKDLEMVVFLVECRPVDERHNNMDMTVSSTFTELGLAEDIVAMWLAKRRGVPPGVTPS